jgi:hypothetical protein
MATERAKVEAPVKQKKLSLEEMVESLVAENPGLTKEQAREMLLEAGA